MKQSQTSNTQSQTRVENKDNLDSRHKEEQKVKDNHITSNHQEQHSKGKSQKQSK